VEVVEIVEVGEAGKVGVVEPTGNRLRSVTVGSGPRGLGGGARSRIGPRAAPELQCLHVLHGASEGGLG
jgi:hypothetical protein